MTRISNTLTPGSDDSVAMVSTRAEVHHISILGWSGLLIMLLLLGALWGWLPAAQWQIQSGLIWLLVLYEIRRSLPLNHAADGALYSTLGLANRLTIMRGWLIACTGGFLFQHPPLELIALIPAILYALSAIMDRIDGYAARRTGQVSQMGIELDTVFDALGLAVAPMLAVWYGKIHWSYLLVSCAYYLFKLGIRHRQRLGLPVFDLRTRPSRRAIAGFQMGFIAVVLFPVFQPPVTLIAGYAFMLPVLAGFLIDWLIVSGRISNDTFINHRLLRDGEDLISYVTQPLLRLVLAATIWAILVRYIENHSLPAGDIPNAIYVMAACGVLILLGILGRLAALLLVLLLGWFYASNMVGLADYVVVTATIWILVLGTGGFSLYTWDQDWVNRYDGKE